MKSSRPPYYIPRILANPANPANPSKKTILVVALATRHAYFSHTATQGHCFLLDMSPDMSPPLVRYQAELCQSDLKKNSLL